MGLIRIPQNVFLFNLVLLNKPSSSSSSIVISDCCMTDYLFWLFALICTEDHRREQEFLHERERIPVVTSSVCWILTCWLQRQSSAAHCCLLYFCRNSICLYYVDILAFCYTTDIFYYSWDIRHPTRLASFMSNGYDVIFCCKTEFVMLCIRCSLSEQDYYLIFIRFLCFISTPSTESTNKAGLNVCLSICMYVCPSIHKKFSDFNEIWRVGGAWWLMVDSWWYAVWPDPRSRSRPWKFEIITFSNSYLWCLKTTCKWLSILKLEHIQYLYLIRSYFWYLSYSFCITWLWEFSTPL